MIKRIISLFLVAVMLLITFSVTTVLADSNNATYYLDANGSDSNDGLTVSTPFATLKKAIQTIGNSDGTVKIIGTFIIWAGDYAPHTGYITIEGYDSSSVVESQAGAGITFGGPVIFKNITYKRGNNAYIVTAGKDIIFGNGFATSSSNDYMVFGGTYGASSVEDINVTVNSGKFTGKFNVGAVMPASGFTVNNDANIMVNGGSIDNILLGSTSWGSCGTTTFSKNVVIENNGGTISKISAMATGNGSPTAIKGALIVINNNGITAPVYDATLDNITIGSKYYINSGVGGLITPALDNSGNAIVGKFNINLDSGKSAVITNAGNEKTISDSGVITLNTGITTIDYVENSVSETVYYVSSNGSDTNNGLSVGAPLATIKKAMTLIGNGDGKIKVIGTYIIEGSDYAPHSGSITIEGCDTSSVIESQASAGITFGGPVTLKNITYKRGNNAYIVTSGNDIVFGEEFNTNSSNDYMIFGGRYGATSVDDINVTVNSGKFTGRFNIGAVMPASGFTVNNDANIKVNGGSIDNILLGSTSWGSCGTTTFSKNVVIENNGGTISKISATATGNGSPTVIKGALIIINNNGTIAPVYDATLDNIMIGSKYYITSGIGGLVTPVLDSLGNAVEGKFNISLESGKSAVVTNGSDKTTLTTSGTITLKEGNTIISYSDSGTDDTDNPPNPGETIPMTWKDMDKGYITLCFDDNNTELGDFYKIITGEYNMPFCAAVPTYTLPQNISLLHEIENHGGEILSHTKNHLVIKPFVTPWEDVEAEFSGSYNDLIKEGFNVNGIILAGGDGQIKESDTEYRGLIERVTNKYYKYSDKYGLSTQYWKQRNWFDGRTIDQLKKIIDTNIQNKTWEVIYAHRFSECSEETLRAVLDYLAEKEAAGLVDVVTYKYMHENFGDWQESVEFGDTKYTVEFYGTDKKTFLGKKAVVEGENAIAPENIVVKDGYTLKGWSASLNNVTNNYSVYAVCTDKNGNIVDEMEESPISISKTYYLDSVNGLDTNLGTSEDAPKKTINDIVNTVGSNDFNVIVKGTYTLSEDVATHTGTMTISGFDSNAIFATADSKGCYLGGNTVIKNIIFKNGLYAYSIAGGKKLVLGEGITTQGSQQVIAGRYYSPAAGIDITINSGTYNKLVLGNMATGSQTTFTEDVKAVINDGKINNIVLSNDGWSTSSQKGSVYDKNIAIMINGGTVSNITALSGYPSVYNGALEIIFNNGATSSINSLITDAMVSKGQYYIYSTEGGSVDFATDSNGQSVTGKFIINIPSGKYAEITNGQNVSCVFNNGEIITLDSGITTVEYKELSALDNVITVTNGENEYFYYPNDNVKISHSGTIRFPTSMEKNGMIFGGWYSDKNYTSPVINGTEIFEGTIYARWISLNEKDLVLNETAIKTNGKLGLRYISSISDETTTALISLNSRNSAIDFADDEFNLTKDIGYGTVILPTDLLKESKLKKGLTVENNGIQYSAETISAHNLYSIEQGYKLYNVTITEISEESYSRYYSARPYITYVDASNVEHTVYGNVVSSSLYETAKMIYESGAENVYEPEREEKLEYLYNNILMKVDVSMNPLSNTYRALNIDKKLTIGYIGGSITNGNSAAKLVNSDGTVSSTGGNIAYSYVNRTTAWFEETYPEAKIEFVNAGISDTATNFANYRLESHLMNENGHDMPDLVFVEFTTNDWIYDDCITQSKEDIKRQIESLVRNIYSANPYADIVFLFTVRSEGSQTRVAHIEVAEHYGIEYIDMGIPMQKLMNERGVANESSGNYYYTVDNLHPSAEGYGVYFEQIKDTLSSILSDTVYYSEKANKLNKLPEQLCRSLWLEPSFIKASDLTVSGNISSSTALKSSMYCTSKTSASSEIVTPDSILIQGENAKVSFTFTGTSFALVFGMNSDGFNIDYTINGRDKKNITIDDSLLSGQKYSHTQMFVLEQELAYDTYTVNMTFNSTTSGKVNVRLGGVATFGVDNGLDKLVALTFDDGPIESSTCAILDVLEKYNAKATFFCVGCMINSNTTTVLKRIVDSGNEIGNHSNNYSPYLNQMTSEKILSEFNSTQQKVYNATGVFPKVFRAPGLQVSDTVFETIPLPFFGGYSNASDWSDSVLLEERIANINTSVGDGRVVLLHDVALNADALDATLPSLIEEGYTFVTLSELYKLRGYNPTSTSKIQYSIFNK